MPSYTEPRAPPIRGRGKRRVGRGQQGVHGPAREHSGKHRATAPPLVKTANRSDTRVSSVGKVHVPARKTDTTVVVGDEACKAGQRPSHRSP